jgi:transposase
MPESYPLELRERVVSAYEAGEGSSPVIAVRFAIGEATVKLTHV